MPTPIAHEHAWMFEANTKRRAVIIDPETGIRVHVLAPEPIEQTDDDWWPTHNPSHD